MGGVATLASQLESISRYCGVPGIVGEKTCTTNSDPVFCELDTVIVKGKIKPASIDESIGLQEDVDSSRTGALTLREPILHAYRSQGRNVAYSQLLRLRMAQPSCAHYMICIVRAAAYGCNRPGAKWIGPQCVEAK